MRLWIAGIVLLLSACFDSERPAIPPAALEQPSGLAGRYWSVQPADGGMPGLVEIRSAPGRSFHQQDNTTSKVLSDFRLVRLIAPDLFLKIADYDENRSVYTLLERMDFGAWREAPIDHLKQDVFFVQNLAYMQALAGRHGLSLDASDADTTRIVGKVDGMAIPGLFRDHDFLATLRTGSPQLLLPSPAPVLAREELFPEADAEIPLMVMQADLPGAAWLQPEGLAGDYLRGFVVGFPARTDALHIAIRADGLFERKSERGAQTFGVLPLAGEQDQFIAVSFNHWQNETAAEDYLLLHALKRENDGWTMTYLSRRTARLGGGRTDLLDRPMNAAAGRQGAILAGFRLTGRMNAEQLMALLRDGQFTTGLIVEDDRGERFLRRDVLIGK